MDTATNTTANAHIVGTEKDWATNTKMNADIMNIIEMDWGTNTKMNADTMDIIEMDWGTNMKMNADIMAIELSRFTMEVGTDTMDTSAADRGIDPLR